MKHAPSKHSVRNTTKNQNTAICYSDKKEQRTHKLAMEIVKLLIDSGLSINDQLKVINDVREKLLFCKKTGQEMKQLTLF